MAFTFICHTHAVAEAAWASFGPGKPGRVPA